MRKEEYIARYGEKKYKEYLKKQALLSKRWYNNNVERARKKAHDYYHNNKK